MDYSQNPANGANYTSRTQGEVGKVQQIMSIRYCVCGCPLTVVATYENGRERREYVDRTIPSERIFRCPNCGASLSEAEDRNTAAVKAG
jgi:hypothetical protein